MTAHKITALVPIKGESERVQGKNLRNFCGEPLLCRVLDTLQKAPCIERVVVNTDSSTVSSLVGRFDKIVVHERPQNLCGHHVPMNAILSYDLNLLGNGHYLQTHVTNPMLRVSTVGKAVAAYFASLATHDSLFSVITLYSRFYQADFTPLNHDPTKLINTQALPPLYEENSCLYLFSTTSFAGNKGNRIGKTPQLFPMSKLESLDIDTEDDFRLAEVAWLAFPEGSPI